MAKVLILTEGGTGIGMGHVARCSAMCSAFDEKKISNQLIVECDHKDRENVLKVASHTSKSFFSWRENINGLWDEYGVPSIVIIDSYIATPKTYELISSVGVKIAYLDDLNRISYPPGVIINGNIYGDKIEYKNHVCLNGIKFAILRKVFWDMKQKYYVRTKIKNVMVVLSGAFIPNFLDDIVEYFEKQNIYCHIVLSGNMCNYTRNKVKTYPCLDDQEMVSLMRECDLSISGGGQIICEMARVGLPTIVFKMADNQDENIKRWEDTGFIKVARNPENLNSFLRSWRSYSERYRVSNIGQNLVDGQGSRRAADFLINN